MSLILATPLLLCFGCASAADAGPVDLELVLTVDVSRSMDRHESATQRAGYVDAIRHPDFIKAVRSGVHGRIALSYFEWAGTARYETLLPWTIIEDADSATGFAGRIAAVGFSTHRSTSISAALVFAAGLFPRDTHPVPRRVIDISGDGPNNAGEPVTVARDAAIADGITINGLPILIRPSPTVENLDRYYAECVVGGPGSFVLPVRRADEFAQAIRRKLILEVSGTTIDPPALPATSSSIVDCRKGERDRERFSDPYFPELR